MRTFGPGLLTIADEPTDAYGKVTELPGAESDIVVLLSPSAGSPGPTVLNC